MIKNYFSAHNHTDYSSIKGLDSIISVKEMIDTAIKLGMKGCAITDHETVAGHVKALNYYNEIKKEHPDFKLVLGNEIYLTRNGLSAANYEKKKDRFWHFLLLAKNKKGHDQLRELSSIAWKENYFKQFVERVPTYFKNVEKVIGENKGNLVASTACLGSFFSNMILKPMEDIESTIALDEFVDWCLKMFPNDFYIELQPSETKEQITYNKRAIKYAKKRNIPLIITTDSHYALKEDRPIHKAYLNANNSEREVDAFYSSTYMMTWDQIIEYCKYIPDEVMEEIRNNTLEIESKCEDYLLDNAQKIPVIPQKEIYKKHNKIYEQENKNYPYITKYLTSPHEKDVVFANKLIEKLNVYCAGRPQEWAAARKDRLEEELAECWETSEKLGERVSAYFTTMEKIMEIAWEEVKTIVGPGRGSVFGMLTAFLLEIIQEDPLNNPIDPPSWRLTLVSLM